MAGAFHITTGDYPRNKMFMNIREFLLIGFVALVLVSGGMFVGVALVYLLLLLGFSIFIFLDAKKRHPEIDFKKEKIDWKLGKSFILPGLIFMAIPFSNIIYLQGSVLIIGAVLGSVAVATFSVHRTLSNLIQRFTSTINPAISPELTASEERGEYKKIQLIHRFFTKVILFISLSLSSALLFIGKDIMKLWTGGQIDFDSNLWIVFLAFIPVLSFWNFSSTFQTATNKYNKLALSRILSTVSGLILAIIFIKPLGLVGVLLGFLISEVLIDFWYIPYNTLKIIKDSKRKFVYSVLGVLPMVALQLGVGWFVSGLFENVWLKIISVGLVITGIGALYLYFFWFNKEEKNIADNFLKKAKNKFLK
jgi:O-antigen/teichoic acid export membrane protein